MDKFSIGLIIVIGSLASFIIAVSYTTPEIKTTEIIIMPGSDFEDRHQKFSPKIVIVELGINNKVRWTNHDDVMNSVVTYTAYKHDFANAITRAPSPPSNYQESYPNYIFPGKSFEFTFTKKGVYRYYNEPNASMEGAVIVIKPGQYDVDLPKVSEMEPNSAIYFSYPDVVKDYYGSRWNLIRLPEELGGNADDESAFRIYSMIDLQSGCVLKYWNLEERKRIEDACHGTIYDPLNGVPTSGPGKDLHFPNNALPKLDFVITGDEIHITTLPIFTVEKNGVIGYGRVP